MAKERMLYQSQRIFEQWERKGRLLAWLYKEQSSSTYIACIKDADGSICDKPDRNKQMFCKAY